MNVMDVDMELAYAFLKAIIAERHRAHAKHGATSMEQEQPLSPWRGAILGEEALECTKALNDERHGEIQLFRGQPNRGGPLMLDDLDKEIIQTAAMAYTWWANRRGDRLPFDPPMPEPGCQWAHEGRTCGMPRHSHSTDAVERFIGHEFVEPTPEHLQNESYGAVELLRKVLTSTFPPMPLRREIEQFLNPVDVTP